MLNDCFKSYKNYIMILSMLMLTACAGLTIDTINKRLAVFEIAYSQTLITIKIWIDEGRLTSAETESIKKSIADVSAARKSVYEAKRISDFDLLDTQLAVANAALSILREFVSKREKPT